MKNFRNDIKINDLAQPFLEQIIKQMTTVFDPEIELDIYNLGLIYEITVDENGHCYFLMTFTDTGCGCEETMPYEIAEKLKSIDGINSVKVETTYSPVWKMTRFSRYGRIALGISPRGGKKKENRLNISNRFFTRVTTDKPLLIIILPTTVSGFNIKKSHRTNVRCEFVLYHINRLYLIYPCSRSR